MALWQKIKNFFKKVEFSKLIAGVTIVVLSIIAIYSVISFNIAQLAAIEMGITGLVPDVAVECIRGILVTILVYCTYQFGNKNSRNKYGIDKNGVPYTDTIIRWLESKGINIPINILQQEEDEDDNS